LNETRLSNSFTTANWKQKVKDELMNSR